MQRSPLIEAAQLNELISGQNLVLIDTRDDHLYHKGHLPGAVQIHDIFTYISLPENGGLDGLYKHFSRVFSKAGLRHSDEIVIYEDTTDNGYGQSCRGWLILQYLGFNNVRVLHGGFRAWQRMNYPVDQKPVIPEGMQPDYQVTPRIFVTAGEVLAAGEEPNTVILDCRDYAEWIGANSSPYGYDYCPRKGRIPGAIWLEWYRFMRHERGVAWFEKPERIRSMCEVAGLHPGQTIYVYCFKGARASAVVLALKLAGFRDVRNYFSSWNEWSREMYLPIDEGYPDD